MNHKFPLLKQPNEGRCKFINESKKFLIFLMYNNLRRDGYLILCIPFTETELQVCFLFVIQYLIMYSIPTFAVNKSCPTKQYVHDE